MTTDKTTLDADRGSSSAPQTAAQESPAPANPVLALSMTDIRHNLICILLINIFWNIGGTASGMSGAPLLVFLKASNKLIGAITGFSALALVGCILSPWITRRFRYKKKYVFFVNCIYLLPELVLGGLFVLAPALRLSHSEMVWVYVACAVNTHLLSGFVTLPTQEFLAATIPMTHRGRLMGYSASAGALCSLGSSALGSWILLHYGEPMAFGYLFLFMWLMCSGGYVFALFTRETPTPVERSPQPWSRRMFKDFWQDRAYFSLILLNGLGVITISSIFGFVVIYGFKELKMVAATTAIIQVVRQVVHIALGSFIGMATDRYRPYRTMPWCILFAAASLLPPILLRNAYGVYISVGLSCIFATGWSSGMGAFNTGLPRPEHRAGHMSFAVLASYFVSAVGAFSMGCLCDAFPYRTVFAGVFLWALVYFFIARLVMAKIAQDPRMSPNPQAG